MPQNPEHFPAIIFSHPACIIRRKWRASIRGKLHHYQTYMRHFRHPSLSIRRFWGKGERWKRKRERATVWPSSGACVATISLFFNLQWGVFEYLYNITGIITCFKNCVSVRSPTLSFVNKRAPENCKLLLFTELHQALVWQLKSWCYPSYPRAVERSCKNK